MLDQGVWHGVKLSHLTDAERKAIIRSSNLKDKYFASGVFEKFTFIGTCVFIFSENILLFHLLIIRLQPFRFNDCSPVQ